MVKMTYKGMDARDYDYFTHTSPISNTIQPMKRCWAHFQMSSETLAQVQWMLGRLVSWNPQMPFQSSCS